MSINESIERAIAALNASSDPSDHQAAIILQSILDKMMADLSALNDETFLF